MDKKKPEELNFSAVREITREYLSRNKFSISLLFICVVLGGSHFLGLSHLPPWKNWEISAIGFTVAYTIYIYVEGFQKDYFKKMSGYSALFMGSAMIMLLICFLIPAIEFTHFGNLKIGRRVNMFVLLITTLLFVALDFTMFKSLATRLPEVSKAYFLSLKFSDIPISVAFACLFVYALLLGDDQKIESLKMDSFFGGTIAFQMMLSNLIWTLTDDVFIEHKRPRKTKKPS